jgi:hypothetical protein
MKTDYIFKANTDYEILTPSGFQSFAGIRKLSKDKHYKIALSNGVLLKCSTTHKFISNGSTVSADMLIVGDCIDSNTENIVSVIDKTIINNSISLFDIVDVAGGNMFNVDGIVSHNCDFVSSGDTVIDPQLLMWYKQTWAIDPIEKTGFDGNLWRWEHPDYTRNYMVAADVARGDSNDYSTAQVIDLDNCSQVAEYKGKMNTKDFGNFLVSLATEYNNALLVVENSNVGWAAIQQVINRGYGNLFYMSNDLKYIDIERQMSNKYYREERKMVAGFSVTQRTRPLIISALDTYIREKEILLRSTRIIDELFTFIWYNGRAEAMKGYNDDLTMALAIGLWVRNTALRLRSEGIDLTKSMIDSAKIQQYESVYTKNNLISNPYELQYGKGEVEDIRWLLG